MNLPWQKIYRRPEFISSLVTFLGGISVHLFALTNVIHNYDDIAAYPMGLGTGIGSGRWFLEILNRWFSSTGGAYNLAYVNGLLFILLIALSTFFLISALEIKSSLLASIIGLSFVVFPTAASILFFRFTSHIYGLAVLFSVMAVWVAGKFRFSFLLSAVLIALSLGLYQGYLPLTAVIFVMMLARQLIEDSEGSVKKYILRGIYYCSIIVLGLILYMIAQNFFMGVFQSTLSGYRGMGSTSSYTLDKLPELLYRTLKPVLLLPFRDYCDIANLASIRKAYFLIGLITAMLCLLCLFVKKPGLGKIAVLVLLCIVFPFAVNLIVLMAPEAELYTMMVYAFVALLWLPLLLTDILAGSDDSKRKVLVFTRRCAIALVGFVVLSYSYYANVNYNSMYFASKQTENYYNALVTQIRMTEGFDTDKKWAFVGKLNDPLLENRWELGARYGGSVTSDYLLHCYSRYDWIRLYFGYNIPYAENSAVEAVKLTAEYENMPCWPAEGSIKLIDDIIVIKFSED